MRTSEGFWPVAAAKRATGWYEVHSPGSNTPSRRLPVEVAVLAFSEAPRSAVAVAGPGPVAGPWPTVIVQAAATRATAAAPAAIMTGRGCFGRYPVTCLRRTGMSRPMADTAYAAVTILTTRYGPPGCRD